MCTHSSRLGGLAGFVLAIAVFGSATAPVWSQVPQRVVHQGILQDTDGIALPDGPHVLIFTLHDAAEGGATLWTEEHSGVETADGLFHVILGSIVPLDVAFDQSLWLGMAVDGSPPLTPRLELTASPYAFTTRSVLGETNVFPSDGDVGIGTAGVAGKSQQAAGTATPPQAKLDVEGDLRIGVVEEATDATKVLVQEDADQIVRYVPIEDLSGGGFSLPFRGTVSVAQPAFDVTNVNGNAIYGESPVQVGVFGVSDTGFGVAGSAATGTGVDGRSDSGTGVDGRSDSGIAVSGASDVGIGVLGFSSSGQGVAARSRTGQGIAAAGDPAGDFFGTVRIGNEDSLGRKARLQILEMEEDPNEENILVWSDDQFVRYKTFDPSGFDGTLNNTALVITDNTGAETTRFNPDGTSFHEGLETFRGGIAFDGVGVGLTFNDGTTQTSGFSLPFDVQVDLPTRAFRIDNQGGDALVGWSFHSSGRGVSGRSDAFTGAGVSGRSIDGTGVEAYSNNGVALSAGSNTGAAIIASSFAGLGLEASGVPAARLNGTVEILTDADVARPSRLKIQEMEEDPTEEKILVWSASDQFVRYKTLSPSGFDGMLNNTDFVITDGSGTETTRINADGTSFHEGLETFRGGIALDGAGVGLTFSDGTTQTTGFGLPFSGTTNVGQTAFRVTNEGGDGIGGVSNVSGGVGVSGNAADGVAVSGISVSGKGVHGFSLGSTGVLGESGVGTGLVGTGATAARLNGTVEIVTDATNARPSRLKIQEMESDQSEERILVWSTSDQFVRYKTLSPTGFDGVLNNTDLVITNGAGTETTRINADGTSFHEGLETFRGGIAVEDAESITFLDNLGSPTSQFHSTDGSGYLACTDADANGTLEAGECKAACDGVECRFNDHTSWGDCTEDETCADYDALDGFQYDFNAVPGSQSAFTVNFGGNPGLKTGGLTHPFGTLRRPGLATSYFLVGNCGGDGIGSSNGCWRLDPAFGSMEVQDQAGVVFMQTDATSQLLLVENLAVNDLTVNGALSKPAGSFKIDHPLDPENKYLYHSFVESPDMMNLYNGNVVLDERGEAVVELPDWFEALNRDFRYQLTSIGGPGPNLYVAKEIADRRFTIAGGSPGLKVSWMVTGIRHDPYAEEHRIPIEADKPPDERGSFLHPEVYGRPAKQGLLQIPMSHNGR